MRLVGPVLSSTSSPAATPPASAARVTVVMITWNRRADVLETLPRLLALPEQPPVIVVDNGSDDGTAEAVRARHPEVVVVALAENRGAAGRNVGVEHAVTPYVAFADDDSWWAPGALATAADVLDAHPGMALVAGTVLLGEGGPPDPTVEAMRRSSLPLDPRLPGPPVLGFIACGAIARRTSFLAVGGFSALFGVGGEEDLLAVDFAERGWDLAHVPDVVAVHQPSANRDRGERQRILVRNAMWQAWLRRRWPTALRITARTVITARDGASRRGVLDAVRRAPTVLAQRRPVSPLIEGRLTQLDQDRSRRRDRATR